MKHALVMPDGDNRKARVHWSEQKGDVMELCISVDHDEPAWQRMDSAPKDGTRVLLVIDHGEWGDKVWTGLWADGWMVSYGKARTEPTHWMPLPAAPV